MKNALIIDLCWALLAHIGHYWLALGGRVGGSRWGVALGGRVGGVALGGHIGGSRWGVALCPQGFSDT